MDKELEERERKRVQVRTERGESVIKNTHTQFLFQGHQQPSYFWGKLFGKRKCDKNKFARLVCKFSLSIILNLRSTEF